MPKEKPFDTPEVVVRPIFGCGAELDGVPEAPILSATRPKLMDVAPSSRPAVELKADSKVWLLSGPGSRRR
jgi:hypothetical protein